MNRSFINHGINFVAAATLVSGVGISSLAQANEAFMPEAFRVNLDWSFPRASDNWDGGLGLRVQALFPAHFVPNVSEKYSVGFSLGVSSWDANEDIFSATAGTSGANVSGNLSGDVRSVNLGASFIRSDVLPNGLDLSTEVGLMFSSISSDTRIEYQNTAITSRDVDVDNTFSALLAVDANYKANEDLTVFGGIGYQFDLGAGDASIPTDTEKNYTNAIFIRGGLKF